MTRLLLGLCTIAFVALGLSELFGRINAGEITDAWPGVISVAALTIVGTVIYVIKNFALRESMAGRAQDAASDGAPRAADGEGKPHTDGYRGHLIASRAVARVERSAIREYQSQSQPRISP
jgi:hypothetical protein